MKIMKANKKFKKDNERKLLRLGSQITQLNSLVNQSLTVVKKEKERFKQEEQEHILRMFQHKATLAASQKQEL